MNILLKRLFSGSAVGRARKCFIWNQMKWQGGAGNFRGLRLLKTSAVSISSQTNQKQKSGGSMRRDVRMSMNINWIIEQNKTYWIYFDESDGDYRLTDNISGCVQSPVHAAFSIRDGEVCFILKSKPAEKKKWWRRLWL